MQHRSKKDFDRVKIFNMSHLSCELYIDKHFIIIINTKVGLNLEMQDGETLSNMRNIQREQSRIFF